MDRKPGQLTKNVDNVASNLVWAKVVGIGNAGVGKTCLIKHFCETKILIGIQCTPLWSHWQFTTGYQPTVGVDYGFKIQTASGVDLRVHLWDLSGNGEYLDVRNELYGNTDAIFLVFDVTNTASFEGLDGWLKEIIKYNSPMPEICLVANKVDLRSKRSVTQADAKKWASSQKLSYFETSCATGDGVEKMFSDLLVAVLQKRKQTNKITFSDV